MGMLSDAGSRLLTLLPINFFHTKPQAIMAEEDGEKRAAAAAVGNNYGRGALIYGGMSGAAVAIVVVILVLGPGMPTKDGNTDTEYAGTEDADPVMETQEPTATVPALENANENLKAPATCSCFSCKGQMITESSWYCAAKASSTGQT